MNKFNDKYSRLYHQILIGYIGMQSFETVRTSLCLSVYNSIAIFTIGTLNDGLK